MSDENTPVLVTYRRWKGNNGGDIIALFPEIPSDIYGRFCLSYEHVGQHSGADFYGVVQVTKPVTAAEAAPLIQELERVGYRLKQIKRASHKHHDARRRAARAGLA